MNRDGITLNNLIFQDITDMELVCGRKYADREITGVHIMDNPDTVRFFRSGEIIMTTGYILQNFTDNDIEKFFRHLCERGCSGMILKINRFYDSVPAQFIDAANKYDIPVVTLPYKYAMAEIQKLILSKIIMREYELNESEQEVKRIMKEEQKKIDGRSLYNDKSIQLFLYEALSEEKIQEMYRRTIAPIERYDKENNAELISTLAMLINNDWEMKKTAEMLYIHRNTLAMRREKIENLVVDTMEMNIRTALELGYYAREILVGLKQE